MAEEIKTTVVVGTVSGIAIISVALRFYVRIRLKVGVAWDDWWIFTGLVLTFLTGGLLLWGVSVDPDTEREIEKAIDDGSTNTFNTDPHTTYLKLSFICSILYFQVVTAIKVSILLMYRRIFSVNAAFRLQSFLIGVAVVSFWLAATLATLLNCRPLRYSWIGLSPKQHCINYSILWMITGAVEVIIDTMILALPVRMVLSLQLSRKSKASVIFIFLLGGFVIVTGIVRVIYAYVPGSRFPSYSGASLWSAIHIAMAITCACLPTLRPLFARTGHLTSTCSSTMRRRYYRLRGQHAKTGDDAQHSKTGDGCQPLPFQNRMYPEGVAFELSEVYDVAKKDPSRELGAG